MAPHSIDSDELEEERENGEQIEDWDDWQSDEDDPSPDCLCLFCDSRFDSADTLFDHCASSHSFDFRGIVRSAGLDFYGSLKLINFVRSQVAANKCWSCGITFQCKKDLQSHLHAAVNYQKDGKYLWEDDMYLKPFLSDDTLLYAFLNDDVNEDDMMSINKEELMIDIMNDKDLVAICNDKPTEMDVDNSEPHALDGNIVDHLEKTMANNAIKDEGEGPLHLKPKNKQLRVSFANVARKEITKVNDNYFGAYGQFGIHREMISDSVRTDTYREAILKNPSLLNRATVMDVGCGTGILSLFAAQAGASRVFAVEASVKMASVATQIVKDNGLLAEEEGQKGSEKQSSGVINVVHGMVEELDKVARVLPHSVDVLVSEWMGYCLLYESMLCSVIYARDHWLKPGGAILPDTASIFVAGFGRGGTSLPFWENVYGFDMSCVGKEVVQDSARAPIVDVIDSRDLVTESVVLQCFDLATMKVDEMDFTANCELELKADLLGSKPRTSWCHGIVLWFETGFTSRFCKEAPIVLSTSPYSPSTHWSQTIFTFQEPIAMASCKSTADLDAAVGTERCPAVRISSRISIARSSVHHRSIDISLEATGISSDGRKHSWPAQIFNL